MSKTVEKENFYEDGNYVVKKTRKHSILAFIVCVLVAFTIWLYATNKDNERIAKDNSETVVNTEDSIPQAEA